MQFYYTAYHFIKNAKLFRQLETLGWCSSWIYETGALQVMFCFPC